MAVAVAAPAVASLEGDWPNGYGVQVPGWGIASKVRPVAESVADTPSPDVLAADGAAVGFMIAKKWKVAWA